MSDQTMAALEFPGLLRLIQQYATSALGRSWVGRFTPCTDLAQIQRKFQEIRELQDLEHREGPVPLADFPDLSAFLHKAAVPGTLLPPTALNDILTVLRLTRQVRHYLDLAGPAAPRLHSLAARLSDLLPLQEVIQKSISPHNFILDQASPALAQVRRDLADTREQLNRFIKQTFFTTAYQEVIQSPTISQRHGRYVIPVKADHKGAIPGIIHDQSQTRATLFLEPLAIVEHNNALNLLINREKREEEAVLRHLTDLVRHDIPAIQENLAGLAEVDGIQARDLFAREYRAREPIFRPQAGVDLLQAYHPLLLKRQRDTTPSSQVVPIDLLLSPEQRFLIISGANAGGKTVALKTLGLLVLMVQSGIPVPVAEGSSFSPFDQIFADIGDPQDLHQDLSTFSAHLKRALKMLAELSGRALILLDELGTATDPNEGGALALALLSAFYRRGAYGAVTTHLPLLKSFAQRQIGFQNAAVVFDEATQRPTYRLAYGLAGASNALKIARELGLSAEILAEAEGYLNREELQAYRLLNEVEEARQHLRQQEQELDRQGQALAAQVQELAETRRNLEDQQRRLQGELREQAQACIRQAEGEFRAILRSLQKQEASWGHLRRDLSQRAAHLLQEVIQDIGLVQPERQKFAPGQKIFLSALNLHGEVLTAPGRDGRLEVRVRKVKLKVRPEDVMAAPQGPGDGAVAVSSGYHLPPETLPTLNLVGLRVDEAIPLLDRLLDQAILHGQERVDIIHGVGTGRLKQAVWQHLKQHTMVKAIHGDVNPGVTIVDLKE